MILKRKLLFVATFSVVVVAVILIGIVVVLFMMMRPEWKMKMVRRAMIPWLLRVGAFMGMGKPQALGEHQGNQK